MLYRHLRNLPLGLHPGFDDVLGTGANRQNHFVVSHVLVQPYNKKSQRKNGKIKKQNTFLRQSLQNSVTGIESLHAFERTAVLVHDTIVIKDIDELQVVSLAALVIVGVMGRGNLDGTCER